MRMLGPRDATRLASAESLLTQARAAGADAGVTRLAELTRLDRLGLPVWQAVRPMSRALSVHQGKGATDADARLGALLEAIENHRAEIFDEEGPCCGFAALAEEERAPLLPDLARRRGSPPAADDSHRWVATVNPLSGRRLYLPFDLVSLDFTRNLDSRFERSSNGVAAGASAEEAIRVALHEIIERDAVIEWQSLGLAGRMADTLRLDAIPLEWLQAWRERLDHADIAVRFYHVPSITGTPVFACELNDANKAGAPYRATQGRGCHPLPELALFKALAEAVQARATFIAGAREDILPATYRERPGTISIAFGLPLPPGMLGVDWRDIEPGPRDLPDLLSALAKAGYDRIGIVDLGDAHDLFVVRAFVCGLGSIHRRRRAPLH